MRAIYAAVAATVSIVLFTVFGSMAFCRVLDELDRRVEKIETAEDAASAADYFEKWEFPLSLVTPDGTLDNIEICFEELKDIHDFTEKGVYSNVKSRLGCQIRQLRRLLSFNPKSFI